MNEKGSSINNPIHRLQSDINARFPDVTTTIDPAETPTGSWFLDIRRGDDWLAVVEWRPAMGFGVSIPEPDDYGSGPDEVFAEAELALARVVEIIGGRS